MRVLSALPQHDLTEVPAAARAAEEAGYDVLALAVAAVNTRRMTLGTAGAIGRRFGGGGDGIYARAAEGDAAFLPPDLVQDIRRLPSPFQSHRTSWSP
jgi:hypothetical protein